MKKILEKCLYGFIVSFLISVMLSIFSPGRVMADEEVPVLLFSTGRIGGTTAVASSGMVKIPEGAQYLEIRYDAGSRTNNIKAKCTCEHGGSKTTAAGNAYLEVYDEQEKLLGQTKCTTASQEVDLAGYYMPAYIVARTEPQSSSNTCSGCGHTGKACGEPVITVNVYGIQKSTTPILNIDLADATMIENKSDCAFNVSASFPGGVEEYQWEYTEGGNWVSLVDGQTHYSTGFHGAIDFAGKDGGDKFSKSNLLRITSPKMEMSGLRFRVKLKSGSESEDAISSEAALTVKSKDVSSFASVKYSAKTAQIGSKINLEDVVAYVRFNSDQVADAYELKSRDSKVTFYGFDCEDTTVKAGDNNFRLKMTYVGNETKSIFATLTVSGVDNAPPVFEESVALYEKDKTTLFAGGRASVKPDGDNAQLYICGKITDSVCTEDDVSWAYTISSSENPAHDVSIPVYKSGNRIEVAVKCNGTYTLYAKDNEKNTATKVISVNAYDESPKIAVTPVSSSRDRYAAYDILFEDNTALKIIEITDETGKRVVSLEHDHTSCGAQKCTQTYHFTPTKAGKYTITASDYASNKTEATLLVVKKALKGVIVSGLPENMTVNNDIVLNDLVESNRIILEFADGTKEIYNDDTAKAFSLSLQLEASMTGVSVPKVTIDYGDNPLRFVLSENDGGTINTYTYDWNIVGEDNVAPLPGNLSCEFSDGWDGALTNDLDKTVTLYAASCEDDGSNRDNLTIVWYKDDTEIKRGSIAEGADAIGPFSGEENNGIYTYMVIDEKGNYAMSTSSKQIVCWDTTPPTGEVVILPEGTTEDSKARFKQIQIINAEDNMGLNERPYSFTGDEDSAYGIVGSIVAGENNTYDVYLRDCVGNSTCLRNLTLSGIDSKAPTINGYVMEENETGEFILHIDATDGEDGAKGLSYSLDGENYQESPNFEISESGIYTLYVKDETGNVAKTSTEYADTVNPIITAAQEEGGSGAIIVNIRDDIGLSRLVMEGPGGIKEILQVYDGITEDTVNKEIGRTGLYKFTVTDMSGNSAECEVTVESIAAACSSSILTGLKVTPDSWTSGDVTVIAQLSDTTGLSSSPFSWNKGVPTAMPYVIMNNNGEANVDVCDRYGNVIASDSITVSNIDRISPTMNDLVQSEDKNHLIVEAFDEGSGVTQITISGGPYTTESPVSNLENVSETGEILITLPTNGSYTVRAYDGAGNSCQKQITVEGVTTDVAKVITEEKIIYKDRTEYVDNVIENTVYEDRIVEQKVEVPVPILVPVPTIEYVTRYKTLKENGEDTTKLIREKGEDIETLVREEVTNDGSDKNGESENELTTEKLISELEKAGGGATSTGDVFKKTKDGTYIGPDGYEYYGRIDPNLKKNHPFKYWFKVNSEIIAIVALVIAALLLILCIIMAITLFDKDEKRVWTLTK